MAFEAGSGSQRNTISLAGRRTQHRDHTASELGSPARVKTGSRRRARGCAVILTRSASQICIGPLDQDLEPGFDPAARFDHPLWLHASSLSTEHDAQRRSSLEAPLAGSATSNSAIVTVRQTPSRRHRSVVTGSLAAPAR
jgi:hypothetical protein